MRRLVDVLEGRVRVMVLRTEDWEARRREILLERAARLAARGRGGVGSGGIFVCFSGIRGVVECGERSCAQSRTEN